MANLLEDVSKTKIERIKFVTSHPWDFTDDMIKVIKENDSSLAPGKERVTQNGMNGCKSITYKILKLNGKEVSRTVLSSDTYDPMNKIIKVGPSKTTEVSTQPVEEPEPTPTTPTTPETPSTPSTPTTPEPGTGENTGSSTESN